MAQGSMREDIRGKHYVWEGIHVGRHTCGKAYMWEGIACGKAFGKTLGGKHYIWEGTHEGRHTCGKAYMWEGVTCGKALYWVGSITCGKTLITQASRARPSCWPYTPSSMRFEMYDRALASCFFYKRAPKKTYTQFFY